MKKLIAAAVAAAIVAPMSAIAAGPTLYGKIHMSVDQKDTDGAAGSYDEWSLNSNSSRIGVKGSEDLGNGLKAGYLIEWNVDMDGEGGQDMTHRNRAVTLSGDFGTALIGKWDTPYKKVGRKFDLFGDKIGDYRALTNYSGYVENRANNVAAYVTPNMSGFTATVAYVFDYGGTSAASGDDSDDSAWSFNGIYKNGPVMVGVGYVNYDHPTLDPTAWRIGGSFKMGDIKLLASYHDSEDQGANNADPSVWTLGAAYKMGNNTIKFQYGDRDESMSNADDGADQWSLGVDHKMSKRTTVYTVYSQLDNESGSNSNPWSGTGHDKEGGKGATGQEPSSFSVGIIHKF